MTTLSKLLLALCLVASPLIAEEKETRGIKNFANFKILRGTPVSIMSYGIQRLNEDLRGNEEWYFDGMKQDNEHGLLQAFDTFIWEPEPSPVIMIRGTIYAPGSTSNRSKAKAEELCQDLLDKMAQTVGIYLDDDNSYFNGLWSNELTAIEYKRINHNDIQNMVYLKGRIGYSGSEELSVCERFF